MATVGVAPKKTVSPEDQVQINKFARLHKQFLEIKQELRTVGNEIQNLNDAADEVMLLDDNATSSIPFQLGSVFAHYDQDTVNEKLESAKEKASERAVELEKKQAQIDSEMKQLKTILYAKFGDNISLEMEADE
ncbi:Prefoldin subunit 4 [Aphelenchoides avenae]|nr:Prefoldin subunit 4 [Aphelenchus avenae]